MKRVVLCVPNPQDYLDQLDDYSIMVVNPDYTQSRKQYLLERADWSLKITANGVEHRSKGKDYGDERLLWYTSGTVGDSKFYSFNQQQLDRLCDNIIRDLEITANDRYMGVMSLWHAHGQSLYWATQRAGCETKFATVKQLRQMTEFQPTFVSAIPDVLKVIKDLPLNNLRLIRSGSAPLAPDLYHALSHKFSIPVVEYFGMTEAMSHVLSNPLQGIQKPGTVGLPTCGVEARLDNGHLWIRSQQAYTTEWFDTGDLAEQDESGYFRILGRSVDQINVRGYKINPSSIENQLKEIFPELEAVVVFGKESCNCVYVGDVDQQHIIARMQDINNYCRPNFIKQVQSIPTSESGKISRIWLCEHYCCK